MSYAFDSMEFNRRLRRAQDEVRDEMRDMARALSDTKSIIGEIDPSEFETPADVYRLAFETMGLPKEKYDDVDESAYPTIFKLARSSSMGGSPSMAGDSALPASNWLSSVGGSKRKF